VLRYVPTYRFNAAKLQLRGEDGFVRKLEQAVGTLIKAPITSLLHPAA
jgi:hypothetical protein